MSYNSPKRESWANRVVRGRSAFTSQMKFMYSVLENVGLSVYGKQINPPEKKLSFESIKTWAGKSDKL